MGLKQDMFKKYLLNTSGNFATMFAVTAAMLLAGIGAAIDMTGASNQRQSLQNIADAAVLAAVTANTEDLTELQLIVDERVALLNAEGWDITATVQIVGDDIVVDATTNYDTVLMGMFGKDDLDLSVTTASPIVASIPINVALVLDTTDSMSGANIDALRDAADVLLTDLEALDADIRVSIVPFGQYVNIVSQEGEPWLDTSLKDTTVNVVNEPYQTRDIITASICTPTGRVIPGQERKLDGVVIGYYDDYEEQSCTAATYGPYYTAYRNYQVDYTWHGCAGSRDNGDNDKAAYDGVQIPGAMEITKTGDVNSVLPARCGQELVPLTDDYGNLKSIISTLTTSGETYIPTGLMWGWRTLSPSVPFTEASSSPDGAVSALIFMTDGFNTRSQDGVLHSGYSESAGVTLAADICENIKDDGIQVFTIGYNMPAGSDTAATIAMLQNCASGIGNNYDPNNAAQLTADFKEIGNRLKHVRLKY